MVMPGDNVSVEIELIAPVAMEKAIAFAIREGGRTIGAGRVARFLTNLRNQRKLRVRVVPCQRNLRRYLTVLEKHRAVAQLVE